MRKKTNIESQKKKHIPVVRISIGVFLILILGVLALGYGYYHSKIELLQRENDIIVQAPDDNTNTSIVEEDTPDDDATEKEMQDAIADLEEQAIIKAEGEIFGDKDIFNVLLIGTDERTPEFSTNARGDTCMLLSINKNSGNVKLVSFERGMGVPILDGDYEGQYDWLTHTFRYGGADLMMKEIRECFKVEVNRYVRVNLNTFEQGINAIGGVDISLSQAEYDGISWVNNVDSGQAEPIHVGVNHLNGFSALQYARLRSIDSDWRRIERQRTVVQAAINQAKSLNLIELDSMLNTVLPLVQTNLTEWEITSLLLLAPKYNSTMMQMTIPVKDTYGGMTGMGGRSLYAVDFQTNSDILKEFLYEINKPVKGEN